MLHWDKSTSDRQMRHRHIKTLARWLKYPTKQYPTTKEVSFKTELKLYDSALLMAVKVRGKQVKWSLVWKKLPFPSWSLLKFL